MKIQELEIQFDEAFQFIISQGLYFILLTQIMNQQYQDDENLYESHEGYEVKNQYSTFIEQLEQTTEKLMDQVFNSEYQPDQQSNSHYQQKLKGTEETDKRWSQVQNGKKKGVPITQQTYGNFAAFLLRSQKWIENKQRNRQKQEMKKDKIVESTITEVPKILRGSIQKLEPIWVRTSEIQHHKHQKLALKRIDKKKQEQERINKISFKPKVNKTSKNQQPRTLQQYIKDKEQWLRKRNQKIERKKLLTQASKYEQCSFQPFLETKRYNQRHLNFYLSGRVQDRLLRSLQKSVESRITKV